MYNIHRYVYTYLYISYYQHLTAYLKLPHIGLKIRNSSSSVGGLAQVMRACMRADAILSTIGPVARWLLIPNHHDIGLLSRERRRLRSAT